jgi:hypothetical protein
LTTNDVIAEAFTDGFTLVREVIEPGRIERGSPPVSRNARSESHMPEDWSKYGLTADGRPTT